MHAIAAGYGGVPLLYMGDELGLLNDSSYLDEPEHREDDRWAHRPRMDWQLVESVAAEIASGEVTTPVARLNTRLRHLLEVRTQVPQLHAGVLAHPMRSPDARVLVLERRHPVGTMVQVYNVSSQPVNLHHGVLTERLGYDARELLGGHHCDLRPQQILLYPYQSLWLVRD